MRIACIICSLATWTERDTNADTFKFTFTARPLLLPSSSSRHHHQSECVDSNARTQSGPLNHEWMHGIYVVGTEMRASAPEENDELRARAVKPT